MRPPLLYSIYKKRRRRHDILCSATSVDIRIYPLLQLINVVDYGSQFPVHRLSAPRQHLPEGLLRLYDVRGEVSFQWDVQHRDECGCYGVAEGEQSHILPQEVVVTERGVDRGWKLTLWMREVPLGVVNNAADDLLTSISPAGRLEWSAAVAYPPER